MKSKSNEKLRYRSDIDGLRAIAVLSVIAFHVDRSGVRGGFVGVDIFFVISGFLISSIIYEKLESNSFKILDFYVRRIRRIYPALFVVLSVVCVVGWLFLLPSDFVRLGKQILGGSTFVANFVLWWQSGYFSPEAALKPLLHLWSLGVEEQYYLIFPLICIMFFRARSRYWLQIAFLGIAAASMFLNVVTVSRYTAAAYFLPYSRFWELFIGAGLALYMRGNMQSAQERRNGIGIVGLALLAVSVFGINQFDAFPGWWALLPTTGTALLIFAGETSWVNRFILSSKPAVFIGLISYPLYLWHWPILAFMRIAAATWGVTISRHQKGVILIFVFLLSYLTYRYIELPIREIKNKSIVEKMALALLGCVSLTGAFGVLVISMKGFPARLPAAIVALDHDYAPEASRDWRDGTCFLRPDQSADSFKPDCLDPENASAPKPLIFVWGDSHAADLVPGFRALQSQSGVRLAEYTASMCAPIIGLQLYERPTCRAINDAILERIKALKPDVVLLSAYWDYADPDHDQATRAEKLQQTIELVKAIGIKKVVVVGSVPFWTLSVPGLLVGELHHNPNQPVAHRLPRNLLTPHDDTLLKDAALKAGAIYLPVFEDLCDQTGCLVTTGSNWSDVLTSDQSHFTEHGSIWVAQRIWAPITN